jgi:hypothetical protein
MTLGAGTRGIAGIALVGLAAASIIGVAGCSPDAAAAPRAEPVVLEIGGAEIEIAFDDGRLEVSRAELTTWISSAASAVVAYFGRFPVSRFRIVIEPVAGESGVLSGTTWASTPARSRILVGEHTGAGDLARDWVMTHEMVHTAFPEQPRSHHWIEEGTATYIEPLARSWVNGYPTTKVWLDLTRGLPKGLPDDGDHGLDHTHTWGRTYWGGALFCLLADVEIRERTKGSRGLVDALRGILAAGGSDQVDWSIERTLREGDKAVGVPVLVELYRSMKDKPVTPDLDAMWRSLGVRVRDGQVELDDSAPRAAIRRAISTRPPVRAP